MITKTQAGSGAAAAVVIGTGTGVGITLKNRGDENNGSQLPSMPQFTVLSLEDDFDSGYSQQTHKNDKITGWLFGGYLVGTYGVGDSSNQDFNDNSAWWDWSYKRWEKDVAQKVNLSSNFALDEVKSPFSSKGSSETGESGKALNKVCETVYKKQSKDVGFVNTSDEPSKPLIRDLLRYCSPLQQRPKNMDDTKEESSVGGLLSIQYHNLISIKDKFNDTFWKLRNDDFFRSNGNIWSGANLNNSNNPLFYGLYSNRDSNKTKTVKEVCKEAYSLTQDSENTNNKEDSLKFCSWSYGIYLSNAN